MVLIRAFINKVRRNGYLFFAFKLSVLTVTLIILDFIIGSLLNLFYFKQQSGTLYRTTYSLEKTTADLIIFGSSTANHNYYPQVFQKRFNLSCYNTGKDGISVFYQYAVLKAILKRYSPKMVIYDFDSHEFSDDRRDYDRLSALLPYYKTHPEIRSMVDLKSPYEKLKLRSRIYPFNSMLFTIAIGNAELNKKRRGDINGYIPLADVWRKPMGDGNTFTNYNVDSNKVRIYRLFIQECIKAKVKLYIVCSPLFIKPDYVNSSSVLGKKIADENNIRFFDFAKDSTFLNNPDFFADFSHLNYNGALVFSNKLIDSILTIRKGE
jgi:hypothetical protein